MNNKHWQKRSQLFFDRRPRDKYREIKYICKIGGMCVFLSKRILTHNNYLIHLSLRISIPLVLHEVECRNLFPLSL